MSDTTTAPVPPVEPPAAPAATPKPKSPLALTAMILGIIAIVSAIIPGLSFVAWMPAVAAGVTGLIALLRKTPRKGQALTGLILGPVALLVAIVVSVAAIAGLASTGTPSSLDKPAASEAAEDEPAEVEEAPEPVVEVPADVVYTGTGDSILPITLVDGADQVAIAVISHDGSSNFAVWSLGGNMEQQDLLVNTIGAYQGTVPFNNSFGGGTTSSLEISADGNWTVTVRSILALREFDGKSITGVGDDVVVYRDAAGAATITNDGSSNFAIWTYGDSTDLVVNEIGPYTGTVRWTKGPSLVQVTAEGDWSITVG